MQSRKLQSINAEEAAHGRKGPGDDDGNSSDEEADGGQDADAAEKRLHNRHK